MHVRGVCWVRLGKVRLALKAVMQNGSRQTNIVGKIALGKLTIRQTVEGKMSLGKMAVSKLTWCLIFYLYLYWFI